MAIQGFDTLDGIVNKKINITEIVGSVGVMVFSSDQTSTLWHNSETIDLTKTTTNIQLDQPQLKILLDNYMMMYGPKLIEDQLQRLIKEKIRFDMVSWTNDEGLPEVTCQLFYGDKMIDEKTTHTTPKGVENVASPA